MESEEVFASNSKVVSAKWKNCYSIEDFDRHDIPFSNVFPNKQIYFCFFASIYSNPHHCQSKNNKYVIPISVLVVHHYQISLRDSLRSALYSIIASTLSTKTQTNNQNNIHHISHADKLTAHILHICSFDTAQNNPQTPQKHALPH